MIWDMNSVISSIKYYVCSYCYYVRWYGYIVQWYELWRDMVWDMIASGNDCKMWEVWEMMRQDGIEQQGGRYDGIMVER